MPLNSKIESLEEDCKQMSSPLAHSKNFKQIFIVYKETGVDSHNVDLFKVFEQEKGEVKSSKELFMPLKHKQELIVMKPVSVV